MSSEDGRAEIRDAIAQGNEPGEVWDDAADTADDHPESEAEARRRVEGDPVEGGSAPQSS